MNWSDRSRAHLIALLAGFLLLCACTAEGPRPMGRYGSEKTVVIKILDPRDAFALIKENRGNQDFVIVDVRTPEEFESGHIEGAVNINYHSDSFILDLDRLDKKKTYLVYCRTGRRTADTVSNMVRLGFTSIYRIEGDIVKWRSEKLPLTRTAG